MKVKKKYDADWNDDFLYKRNKVNKIKKQRYKEEESTDDWEHLYKIKK